MLYRVSEAGEALMGMYIPPKQSEATLMRIRELTAQLNSPDCFDFDYTPQPGDRIEFQCFSFEANFSFERQWKYELGEDQDEQDTPCAWEPTDEPREFAIGRPARAAYRGRLQR